MRAVKRAVTHSVYGNALHYGLSMFTGFEMFPYSSVIAISVRFLKPFYFIKEVRNHFQTLLLVI